MKKVDIDINSRAFYITCRPTRNAISENLNVTQFRKCNGGKKKTKRDQCRSGNDLNPRTIRYRKIFVHRIEKSDIRKSFGIIFKVKRVLIRSADGYDNN